MVNNQPEFVFLKDSDIPFVLELGEMILGVKKKELGSEFLSECDLFIDNLDDFTQGDLRTLFRLFNSRIMSFILMGKFHRFVDMSREGQERYYEKWVRSKISVLRTGGSSLRALCGWSYYSQEISWTDDYPGKTIGREHLTPTLLEGKEPWYEGMEVE